MEFIHYDYRYGNTVRNEVREILNDYLISNKDDDDSIYYTIVIPEEKFGGVITELIKEHDIMFSSGNKYLFIDSKGYKFRQR